ncbi:MAG: hypothetical protein IJN42_04180 [Clostridia bacterium]|nr:hypothetical protein [Clostridia bacterium]
MKKVLFYTKRILAFLLIICGCVGLLSRWPIISIAVLSAGICMLDSFFALFRLHGKAWRIVLPLLCLLLGVSAVFLPKRKIEVVFPPDDHSVVYTTPGGSKYHYTKNCAGKNAEAKTMELVLIEKYTPCGKCTKEGV